MSTHHFECATEECILINLNIQKDQLEHHSGSGAVCQYLYKNSGLVGLVDEDPNAAHHPYFKKLYNQNKASAKHGIVHCIDSTRNNKLIILQPKFEDWIIAAAIKAKISMSNFNLSDDPNLLHREIISKIPDLQKLIHQLIKVKSPAILYLKGII